VGAAGSAVRPAILSGANNPALSDGPSPPRPKTLYRYPPNTRKVALRESGCHQGATRGWGRVEGSSIKEDRVTNQMIYYYLLMRMVAGTWLAPFLRVALFLRGVCLSGDRFRPNDLTGMMQTNRFDVGGQIIWIERIRPRRQIPT
jgi:hypothetical protein